MKNIIFFIFNISILNGLCQTGAVVESFQNPTNIGLVNGNVSDFILLPNNEAVVVGGLMSLGGVPRTGIAKLNQNGGLNIPFNPSPDNNAFKILEQPDGKFLVVGFFTGISGYTNPKLARINADGSFDFSFLIGSGPDDLINNIQLQSDGKIIITGEFLSFNGNPATRIARLNSDGSFDPTYLTGTGFDAAPNTIALDSLNRLIVSSNYTSYNGTPVSNVIRLNSDGTLDSSFDAGIGADDVVSKISVLSDNRLIVGGKFNSFNNFYSPGLVKIKENGQIDSSFVIGSGFSYNSNFFNILDIDLVGDSVYYVSGSFQGFNGNNIQAIIRMDTTGLFDNSFHPFSNVSDVCSMTKVANDGSLFCSMNNNFALTHILNTGIIDSTYNLIYGFNGSGLDIIRSGNGIIILGNQDDLTGNTGNLSLSKYLLNGDIDTNFNISDFGYYVQGKMLQLSSGNILVAYNNGLYLFDSLGNAVPSFNSGLGFTVLGGSPFGIIHDMVEQNDGKIIVLGYFNSYDGNNVSNILRINPNGSIDLSYNTGTGLNNTAFSGQFNTQGQLITVGYFSEYNGSIAKSIVRINTDGTIDNSFNQPFNYPFYSYADRVLILPNQNILVSGFFPVINGENVMFRLFPDGTVDTSYHAYIGSSERISEVKLLSNNHLMYVGDFSVMSNQPVWKYAYTDLDGNVDLSLQYEIGTDQKIVDVEVNPYDGIYFAGDFNSFRNYPKNGFSKITFCPEERDTVNIVSIQNYYWNQTNVTYVNSGIYTDTLPSSMGCDSIIVLNLTILNNALEIFTNPSLNSNCSGEAFVTNYSNTSSSYTYTIIGVDTLQGNGQIVFSNLCEGLYLLEAIGQNNDTLNNQFVVGLNTNYTTLWPFSSLDTISDTFQVVMELCNVNFSDIQNIVANSVSYFSPDSMSVQWIVYTNAGSNMINTILPSDTGNFMLQFQFYCNQKSNPTFGVVNLGYVNNGNGISTLSIFESEISQLNLFPNPTSDQVTITMSAPSANLRIYDIQGKLVAEQEVVSGSEVSLKEFQTGVYLFEVISEGNRTVKRIVKN